MMTKLSLPEIEHRVREDWPGEPDAVVLLQVVSELEDDEADYITIALLVQILDARKDVKLSVHAGDRRRLDLVYRWTEYLASERIGLLDQHFELVRDDDTGTTLETMAIVEAMRDGKLYDPDTGNLVPDWKTHVIPYYSATLLLKEIVRGRR